MSKLTVEFIEQSIYRIKENSLKINTCLQELSVNEVWSRSNECSNSIANLILHLCGNIRQYIISSLGKREDLRERNIEFSTTEGFTIEELKEKLNSTISEAVEIISGLNEESLLAVRSVQGFALSGIGIIIHVVEHYSYHTGQIIAFTKQIKNNQFDFYAEHDLNQKNKIS